MEFTQPLLTLLKAVGTIPTGQALSNMLVQDHAGRLGYTANIQPGSVSVLDLRANKLLAVIPVAPKMQRIAFSVDEKSSSPQIKSTRESPSLIPQLARLLRGFRCPRLDTPSLPRRTVAGCSPALPADHRSPSSISARTNNFSLFVMLTNQAK